MRTRTKTSSKGFDFFATDSEIVRWLSEGLLAEFQPYEFIGVNPVKNPGSKTYAQQLFSCPANENDLKEHLKNSAGDEHLRSGWLRSLKLTPALEPWDDEDLSACISLSGLVAVDFSRPYRRRKSGASISIAQQSEASISIVHGVKESSTGQIFEAKEYLRQYEFLKRQIRKHLFYTAIRTFLDGTKLEDKSCLISEGAAEEIRRGVPYSVELGNLVKPKRRA